MGIVDSYLKCVILGTKILINEELVQEIVTTASFAQLQAKSAHRAEQLEVYLG